ncbi:MAG: ABC transporter ATP-binding protein [Bdellovibrionia bacterium]
MNKLLSEVLFSRWLARVGILTFALIATFFALTAPFIQKDFIDTLLGQSHTAYFTFLTPVQMIFIAFFFILVAQAFQQLSFYLGAREAILMQGVLSKKIYRKTLDLKVDTLSHRPLGEIVQLYATDVPGATVLLDQTIPAGASTLFPLLLGPFAIAFFFEVPILPTLLTMALIISINTFLAFRQSKFFYNFKQLAGERLGVVNEWIQNIRTIRILGWVEQFEKTIFEKREVETVNRVRMVTNGQMMNAISSSVTFVLNVVALTSLIYFGKGQVTSGELLALLWIVGVFLTRPFRQMPWFFTFAFDAWTSLKRLDGYLSIENSKATEPPQLKAHQINKNPARHDIDLSVRNLYLQIQGKTILEDFNLDIQKGEFVAIVGEVGSGKSMLLLSLLGETGAYFREYWLQGTNVLAQNPAQWKKYFSYVPQEGFIMSASLRENVVFDYGADESVDQNVLRSLQLSQFDLATERVENGLETDIGERGVNLSGGQKQRVSLARVHHHNSPILLLDDCLSAVDVDTEVKLFNDLLHGDWQGRTRILVTHRLSILPKVDRIIFLENGHIEAQGTFDELLAHSEKFREFSISVQQNENAAAPGELL